MALFGILIAVVGILIGLYTETQGYSTEAYLLWGLIAATTLAVVLSSITAGCALAHLAGHERVTVTSILRMVFFLLFLVTACVATVAVVGLYYL